VARGFKACKPTTVFRAVEGAAPACAVQLVRPSQKFWCPRYRLPLRSLIDSLALCLFRVISMESRLRFELIHELRGAGAPSCKEACFQSFGCDLCCRMCRFGLLLCSLLFPL